MGSAVVLGLAKSCRWSDEPSAGHKLLHAPLASSNSSPADPLPQVRGQLSKLDRKTLSALIVIDVHARDVVAELAKQVSASPESEHTRRTRVLNYLPSPLLGSMQSCGIMSTIALRPNHAVCMQGISSPTDFEWMSQLRYSWEHGDVSVRMINAQIYYG